LDLKKKASESNAGSGLMPSMSIADINPLDEEPSSSQTTVVEQDAFFDAYGEMFVYHDIIFPEEVTFLAE